MSAENIVGKKFNKFLVVSREKNIKNRMYWKCLCDCGNEVTVRSDSLKSGHKKSCGCSRGKGEGPFRRVVYNNLRKSAKSRNLELSLTDPDIDFLTQLPCHYCGLPPSNVSHNYKRVKRTTFYSGLDRVDSLKGYILDNVVPCCKQCNWAKSNLSLDNFLSWIARLNDNLVYKGLLK